MKFTPDQISKLEAFLTKCEETHIDTVAAEIGANPTGVRGFFVILRKIGVIPKYSRKGSCLVASEEMEAFRAWKASLPRAAE